MESINDALLSLASAIAKENIHKNRITNDINAVEQRLRGLGCTRAFSKEFYDGDVIIRWARAETGKRNPFRLLTHFHGKERPVTDLPFEVREKYHGCLLEFMDAFKDHIETLIRTEHEEHL
jgi:hypothetical protein